MHLTLNEDDTRKAVVAWLASEHGLSVSPSDVSPVMRKESEGEYEDYRETNTQVGYQVNITKLTPAPAVTLPKEVREALEFFSRHYHGGKSPIYSNMKDLANAHEQHTKTLERYSVTE